MTAVLNYSIVFAQTPIQECIQKCLAGDGDCGHLSAISPHFEVLSKFSVLCRMSTLQGGSTEEVKIGSFCGMDIFKSQNTIRGVGDNCEFQSHDKKRSWTVVVNFFSGFTAEVLGGDKCKLEFRSLQPTMQDNDYDEPALKFDIFGISVVKSDFVGELMVLSTRDGCLDMPL